MTGTKAFIHTSLMALVLLVQIACNGVAPPNLPSTPPETNSVNDSGQASEEQQTSSANFLGCISGVGTATDKIRVNFEFPGAASKVWIYRGGTSVWESSNRLITQYTDTGLIEGETYTYTCKALFSDGIGTGTRTLTITTPIVNRPVFSGITSATEINPHAVTITWAAPSGGATVSKYKIYKSAGSTLNWSVAPLDSNVLDSTFTYDITGLGDELPYTFGVRACTANNICDTNTAAITVTTDDDGVSLTDGRVITAVSANGEITITAPWSDSDGGIRRRYLYRRTGAVGGTNLADYTLIQTKQYDDTQIHAPDTTFTVSGVASTTTYHFIVVDEDPSANIPFAQSQTVSITTPDMAPPQNFSGITNATYCTPEANGCVKLMWTAPAPADIGDYAGFFTYIVEANGTLTYLSNCVGQNLTECQVTGLDPFRTYNFYVRAYDASPAVNMSAVNNPLANGRPAKAGDITPPTFVSGLALSYTTGNYLNWNAGGDNQYNGDSNQLKYTLYRKVGADFIFSTVDGVVVPDGGIIYSGTDRAFLDLASNLIENQTYYYTVCAEDGRYGIPTPPAPASINKYCDQAVISRTHPDVIPPASFVGLTGITNCAVRANGCLKFTWGGPSTNNWTDYRGFKIYSVNVSDALTLVKDCPCSGPNCPDELKTCEATLSNAREQQYFVVYAYDVLNNTTTSPITGPYLNSMGAVTDDVTAPSHISSLNTTFVTDPSTGVRITYSAATDNQVSGNITYEIYRKSGSAVSPANNPTADGSASLVKTTTAVEWIDPLTGQPPATYYYVVCATDATGNRYCDGVNSSEPIADIVPPPGFAGISSIANCTVRADGCVKLTWFAPADWSDYGGFKVYTVNASNNLTEYKDCNCTAGDCTPVGNRITSCEVSGVLTPSQYYKFVVLAYDKATPKNYTLAPGAPASIYASAPAWTADDITPPTYANSGIFASYTTVPSPRIQLSWSATASDAPSVSPITYKVYRKEGSDFSNAASYAAVVAEGTWKGDITHPTGTFDDTSIQDAKTYYYTVCAVDQTIPTSNRTCPGQTATYITTDITPPVITGGSATPGTPTADSAYSVSFDVNDNSVSNVNIVVRRKFTDVLNDYATDSDPMVTSTFSYGTITVSGEEANFESDWGVPAAPPTAIPLSRYVSYRVTATDQAGLPATPRNFQITVRGLTITPTNRASFEDRDMVIPAGTTVTFAIPEDNYASSFDLNSLTIQNGGILTHLPCPGSGNNAPFGQPCYKIDITVAGTVNVQAGGLIDVTDKGYVSRTNGNTYNANCSTNNMGGHTSFHSSYSYAASTKSCLYGDLKLPSSYGSAYFCASCAGGGVVKIFANTLTIDGIIRSNATSAYAAGGSIWIDVLNLSSVSGNGQIFAKMTAAGDAGSGGRIAIYYTNLTNFNITSGSRVSTNSYNGANRCGTGTTFLYNRTTATYGTLLLDNGGTAGGSCGVYLFWVYLNHTGNLNLDSIVMQERGGLILPSTAQTITIKTSITGGANLMVPGNGTNGDGIYGSWLDIVTFGASVSGTVAELNCPGFYCL